MFLSDRPTSGWWLRHKSFIYNFYQHIIYKHFCPHDYNKLCFIRTSTPCCVCGRLVDNSVLYTDNHGQVLITEYTYSSESCQIQNVNWWIAVWCVEMTRFRPGFSSQWHISNRLDTVIVVHATRYCDFVVFLPKYYTTMTLPKYDAVDNFKESYY